MRRFKILLNDPLEGWTAQTDVPAVEKEHSRPFSKAVGAVGGPGPDRLDRLVLIDLDRILQVSTGLEPGDPKSDRRFV